MAIATAAFLLPSMDLVERANHLANNLGELAAAAEMEVSACRVVVWLRRRYSGQQFRARVKARTARKWDQIRSRTSTDLTADTRPRQEAARDRTAGWHPANRRWEWQLITILP